MRGWGSVAQGTGEGQAHGVSLLIVELVAVVPGAKLVNARERTIAARLSRRGRAIGVVQLRDRRVPDVERESDAVEVAFRHVRRIAWDRPPVEDARQHSDAVRHLR